MTVAVVLAIVSVLCALAFLTLAGMWATVEILGWLAARERSRRVMTPVLVGAELDATEADPFGELDVAWLAEHQIGGWLN